VKIHKKTKVTKVEGTKGGPLTIHTDSGEPFEVDTILWAVGRHANTEGLGLENVGVNVDSKGDVIVDEWQASNVKNIWAIGDVQGKALLTPVAIAAGRRLSNRLFGPEKFKEDKLSYEDIPTVVFSYVFFLLSHLKYLT
jgi:glutathione reductase (NADPH)